MTSTANFSLRINSIKTNLLSRDPRLQIYAVNILIDELVNMSETNRENLATYLIGADIVEILCETLSTLDAELLKQTFKALGLLSVSSTFFENRHTVYVISSVLRTLHILISQHKEELGLCTGLEFLSAIITRINDSDIELSSVCDVDQLLQVTRELIKNASNEMIVFYSSELFSNILINLEAPEPRELLKNTISQCLLALCCQTECRESVTLIAEIVKETVRLFLTEGVDLNEDEMYLQLQEILYEILIPIIISANERETDPNIIAVILRCILSFYNSSNDTNTVFLSYKLASMDFINLLTKLDEFTEDLEFSVVIRTLLCEMLICLSKQNLGNYDWRVILTDGLSKLPERIRFWPSALQNASNHTQHTIIIYYYFNLLSSNKLNSDESLLNNLISYIRSKVNEPPSPILKAFWLVFAITYLSSSDKVRSSAGALKQFISWLIKNKIKTVYTHHPAILYWIFTFPNVQKDLQKNVMCEWLDHDNDISLAEVKALALVNQKACSTLLEILSNCQQKVIKIGLGLIESLLSSDECHFVGQIAEDAWSMLPHIITSYKSTHNIENQTAFWKLCSQAVPVRVELSILSKLLCLVPGVLIKYYNISHDWLEKPDGYAETFSDGYRFISVLLVLSSSYKHKTGIAAILNHEPFLKIVDARMSDRNVPICSSTIQLLTHLLSFQDQYEIKSATTVQISLCTLMKLLYGNSQLVEDSLLLLSMVLNVGSSRKYPPVLKMIMKTPAELRALYMQLHMICFKCSDEMTACCWKCLRQLLDFSYHMKEQDQLATIPFTPKLLMASRESVGTKAWNELLSFLLVWLPALTPLSERRLTTPAAHATAAKMVETIMEAGDTSSDPRITTILNEVMRIRALPAQMKSILRSRILNN